MKERLTFLHVKNRLTRKIQVAAGKDGFDHAIVLTYVPSTQIFHITIDGTIDNIYTSFGTQMAIDRFNELLGR